MKDRCDGQFQDKSLVALAAVGYPINGGFLSFLLSIEIVFDTHGKMWHDSQSDD
jgi:hypothetical protein